MRKKWVNFGKISEKRRRNFGEISKKWQKNISTRVISHQVSLSTMLPYGWSVTESEVPRLKNGMLFRRSICTKNTHEKWLNITSQKETFHGTNIFFFRGVGDDERVEELKKQKETKISYKSNAFQTENFELCGGKSCWNQFVCDYIWSAFIIEVCPSAVYSGIEIWNIFIMWEILWSHPIHMNKKKKKDYLITWGLSNK